LRLAQGKLTALESTLPEEVAAAQTALAEARHRWEEGEATVSVLLCFIYIYIYFLKRDFIFILFFFKRKSYITNHLFID
jgi:hypothetical protein